MARKPDHRTGARIRARRLDLGLRQAELAETTGISPSYLNLIEHDKRRIGGQLLAKMARALDVEPALLTDGADRQVLDALHQAAGLWEGTAELARTDDMAARYPGWAGLIAAQSARIAALEARAQLLTDRITYDPDLATALHGMISAVTAIRSTAAILTGDDRIDADWQRRFHRNIHDDAVRLAADSEALISYLDTPDDRSDVPLSPREEVEALLDQTGWHIAALETSESVAADMPGLAALRPAARVLGQQFAERYLADARLLPLATLVKAVRAKDYDPVAVAAALGCGIDLVLRRLAQLPPDAGHPPFGLVICDAAGFPVWSKSIAGFALPRVGACPLWPVFTALGQVGRPVQATVEIPGQPVMRMQCNAVAVQTSYPRADLPPMIAATMLIRPDAAQEVGPLVPAGLSCRICPRTNCVARREPSALGAGKSGL